MFGITRIPYDGVLEEIVRFTAIELEIYASNSSHKDMTQSILANIALFDLEALPTEKGKMQMDKLFSGTHPEQLVIQRLRQLLHLLYIRFGEKEIDALAKVSLGTMCKTYGLPKELVEDFASRHNTFWMVPFLKTAYYHISFPLRGAR